MLHIKDTGENRADSYWLNFVSVMLAVLMVLVMALPAMAADGDELTGDPTPAPAATKSYDYPLTVTGLATGDTVKFYQVVEWVGETDDDSDMAGWKAISTYSTVLTKDVLRSMLVGDPNAQPAVAATGMTSEIAGKLAALATGGEDATSIANGTATYNNASSGMYMAIVTPADANTVYNPVFVSADYNKETGHEGTAAVTGAYADGVAKKSTVTITKTASTTEDTWDDGQSHTTAVGDTVSFTVTTTIPGYGKVYTDPHFVVTDELTALKLNQDSVTVVGLEKGEDKDYTVDPSDSGYTITFTKKYLTSLQAATSVTITYSAIVTTDAANAVNEEDNEVKVEYSHDPNNQSDYDIKKDTTQHYTFTLDASGIGESESQKIKGKKTSELVKIGLDAAGNPITDTKTTSQIGDPEVDYVTGPLEGATFGLFTDSAATVPYKAKNANGSVGTTNMEATSGADGRMTFAGLDAGTYYLKEISAPAGYVTNTTIHTVVISATTKSVHVTEWYKDGAWSKTDNGGKKVEYDTDILETYTVTIDGDTVAEYKFKNSGTANSTEINWEEAELVEHPHAFENTKGTELPSTGGIGTTIFYVVGAILVLGAGIVLVTRRRMRAQ